MSIKGFVVESVTLDDESNAKIDNYELSANTRMQQGSLVGSYGKAVQDAANNPNGAANGFMGIGMMNMASGGIVGSAATGPFQQQNQQPQPGTNGFCSKCGSPVNGPFCSNCGNKVGE